MRLKKSEKFYIILVIIVISILLPVYNLKQISENAGMKKTINNKKELEMFKLYDFNQNVQRFYEVSNYPKAIKKMRNLKSLESFSDIYSNIDLNRTYSMLIGSYPVEKEDVIEAKLNNIEGLIKEDSKKRINDAEFDFDKHIAQKQLSILKAKENQKKALSPRILNNYDNIISSYQSQIDSLNTKKILKEKEKNNNIVFLQIQNKSQSNLSNFDLAKKFVIQFIGMLIISILGFIILSFIYRGISALMNLAGIKSSMPSTRYSRYNSYSRKRKVKRKYKDSDEEEKD